MSNPATIKQETLSSLNFVNEKSQVNSRNTTSNAQLAVLGEALSALGDQSQQGTIEDKANEAVSPLSEQELQAIFNRDNNLMNGIKQQDTTACAEATTDTEETPTTSGSSSSSSGMQAIFDMQGWIAALLGDASDNNAIQAQMEVQNGIALEKSMEEQYEKIEEKEKELEKKKHHHSFWGFITGLGSLVKDIAKMTADITKDIAKMKPKDLVKDVKHDTDTIKNNAAVVDVVDLGKLCVSIHKFIFDMEKDLVKGAVTGNFNDLKKDAVKDGKKIIENPSWGLVPTDVISKLEVILLESFGVPPKVAKEIVKEVTLGNLAKAVTFLLDHSLVGLVLNSILEKAGLSTKQINDVDKVIGDVVTIVLVAALAAATGGASLAFMAAGFALSTLSAQIAEGSGAKGLTKIIIEMTLAVTGALLAAGGAYFGALKVPELLKDVENIEQVIEFANKVSSVVQVVEGVLGMVNGARSIDFALMQKAINDIQAILNTLIAQINLVDTQIDNTSKQLQETIAQYEQMISNFGAISAPAEAVAQALV